MFVLGVAIFALFAAAFWSTLISSKVAFAIIHLAVTTFARAALGLLSLEFLNIVRFVFMDYFKNGDSSFHNSVGVILAAYTATVWAALFA